MHACIHDELTIDFHDILDTAFSWLITTDRLLSLHPSFCSLEANVWVHLAQGSSPWSTHPGTLWTWEWHYCCWNEWSLSPFSCINDFLSLQDLNVIYSSKSFACHSVWFSTLVSKLVNEWHSVGGHPWCYPWSAFGMAIAPLTSCMTVEGALYKPLPSGLRLRPAQSRTFRFIILSCHLIHMMKHNRYHMKSLKLVDMPPVKGPGFTPI